MLTGCYSIVLTSSAGEVPNGDIDLSYLLIKPGVIGINFYHRLRDNSKNTGAISSNFLVGALGTLGQHKFAFGFCGSIGVEISRVRKTWVAVGIRDLRTLLLASSRRRHPIRTWYFSARRLYVLARVLLQVA